MTRPSNKLVKINFAKLIILMIEKYFYKNLACKKKRNSAKELFIDDEGQRAIECTNAYNGRINREVKKNVKDYLTIFLFFFIFFCFSFCSCFVTSTRDASFILFFFPSLRASIIKEKKMSGLVAVCQ
jgi:hypothetical protein